MLKIDFTIIPIMSIKTSNNFLKSEYFLPLIFFVLLIILSCTLFINPLFLLPTAVAFTFFSFIIYKREILLPEMHSQKAWIVSCFFIVIGCVLLMMIKSQEIINQFGELFLDGELKSFERLSEGDEGGEFWEEVTVFIPDSRKGARLLKFLKYSVFGMCIALLFVSYKLFDYESKNTKNDLWFISNLESPFYKNLNWIKHAVPTVDFIELFKYFSTLNDNKSWQVRQKINFQLSVFRMEHYMSCGELPTSWKIDNKSCLHLAEFIIANTVFHFKNSSKVITQNNHLLPYERSLIVKAIAFYIHAIKKNIKETDSRIHKNELITDLYGLFYHIQNHIKASGGKRARKLSTVLKEDVFYPVTNVILVDDHQLFRWGVKKIFENNYSVKIVNEAQNGQELFDLLNHSTSDIISLGIQMPVMDGLAFLDRFNYQEEPKIISLSFLNDPSVVLKALSLGASSYLDKSQGGDAIAKSYKHVHAYGFYYSSNIRETIKKVNES